MRKSSLNMQKMGKVWSPVKVRRSLLDPSQNERKLSMVIPFISSLDFWAFQNSSGWWCITQQKHYGSPWPSARCPGTLPPPAPTPVVDKTHLGLLSCCGHGITMLREVPGRFVCESLPVWCEGRLSAQTPSWTATPNCSPPLQSQVSAAVTKVVTRLSFSVTSLISGSTRCRRTQSSHCSSLGYIMEDLCLHLPLSSFHPCLPSLAVFSSPSSLSLWLDQAWDAYQSLQIGFIES